MDRIQFVNSINHNDKQLSEFIPKYIDQYMILYELVDRKDKVKYLNDNGINQTTFQILSTPDSIDNITRKLSNSCDYTPYGKLVHIDQIPVSNVITNLTLTML
jgi:hypothetical protein